LVVFCTTSVVKATTRILSHDTVVIMLRIIHVTTDRVDLPILVVDE
jgi:hypothetical protein